MTRYAQQIARELGIRDVQVAQTLELHDGGGTVPFIARYRKEATGNLDEVVIQRLIDRAQELKELDDRRATIVKSIEEQSKMTPELASAIARCVTRTELEDLYLPYKPKRRTRATIAREKGLEPLAAMIWSESEPRAAYDTATSKAALVARFIDAERGVATEQDALAGARDIVAERIAESAPLRQLARSLAANKGVVHSEVVEEKKDVRGKFDMYYRYEEPMARVPSHRVLAILRGEREEFLRMRLRFPDSDIVAALKRRLLAGSDVEPAPRKPAGSLGAKLVSVLEQAAPRHPHLFRDELEKAIEESWKRLLSLSLEAELRGEMRDRADRGAIEVFGENLRNLLLSPPAGSRRVVALDPGLRTGTKLAMLDETGRLLETATLYSERSAAERQHAINQLASVIRNHQPDLIAVGNGTGSREAEQFVRDTLISIDRRIPIVSVSEQGASIYSASEVAREEFPDLDLTLRGAISIGRRLQDPLGELVKIDAKSIGVGQYQHDVNQLWLKKKLGETVDSCVNAVGVDLNTASPQLLEHVSGVGPVLARRIVDHRNDRGAFPNRAQLLDVRGLGPRAYEQAAGFLRIRSGHPLDNSAVHPERYGVVEQMARDLGVDVAQMAGNSDLVNAIELRRYITADLGEPTLRDILHELRKPGRDPRGDFTPPAFRDELRSIDDVREGMIVDGVVTNVTAFGAFVDIGVHQDGLVHISQLSNKFVRDPNDVVKVGDRVTAKVSAVDVQRKRIGLSIKEAMQAS
jgi:uncharacterized protein